MIKRFPHADDQALGQAYLDLYRADRDPVRMADTKAIMDRLVVRPDDPNKLLWWWCDALFMSPPVLARAPMPSLTIASISTTWTMSGGLPRRSLYDPQEHLYFRDSRYLTQKQENGKKLFWSRGNGWVMGGARQRARVHACRLSEPRKVC